MIEQLATAHLSPEAVRECVRDLTLAMSEWEHGHPGSGLGHGTSRRLVANDGGRRVELSTGGRTDDRFSFPDIDLATVRPEFQEFSRNVLAYRGTWNSLHARIDALVEAASASSSGVKPVDSPCWVIR